MGRTHLAFPRTRAAALAVATLFLCAQAGSGFGQVALPEHIRRTGDEIHFCVNRDSVLAELDRAVALAVADALLLPATIHEIGHVSSMRGRFEFGLPVDEFGLLTVMTERCQVVMGYQLTRRAISWISVTQPYYATNMVLASVGDGGGDVREAPAPPRIGSRMGGPADAGFSHFLTTQSPERRWNRIAYPHYGALLSALLGGAVDGAVVWEPGLYAATGGDPAARGIAISPLPFSVETVDFGMAVIANDTYMRAALDEGIRLGLTRDVVAGLAERFGLPMPVSPQ